MLPLLLDFMWEIKMWAVVRRLRVFQIRAHGEERTYLTLLVYEHVLGFTLMGTNMGYVPIPEATTVIRDRKEVN